MRDFLIVIGFMGGFILALIAISVAIVLPVDRIACRASTRDMSLPSRWSIFGSCQIHHPTAGWIPLANYRVTAR